MRPAGQASAILFAAASLALVLVLWQAAVDLHLIKAFFVSSPLKVYSEFLQQSRDGTLFRNVSISLSEFGVGLTLSIIVGGGLGALAGAIDTLEHVFEPIVWLLYSAPIVAFYPIFVAIFGLGEPTIIVIAFLFAVTPIYANMLSAIKEVDANLVRIARAFGATRFEILLKVILPGSVPIMLAGLRLSVGRALTGVIVGEFFGASAGLGFSIGYYGDKLRTTDMMVSIVTVVVLGVTFTQTLSFFEVATQSWRTGFRQ